MKKAISNLNSSWVIMLTCLFIIIGTAAVSSPVPAQDLVYSHQLVPTVGAVDWESFVIDGETYLAVANYRTSSTYNIDSKIYKWDGAAFIEIQSIPTQGAHDWESFTIEGETYLAVANRQDGSTYNIDSKIYKWDGAAFQEIQSIPTFGAADWESFIIEGETYLAVANFKNDSSLNITSNIFRWNGSSFIQIQSVPSSGASDWESFVIDGETYLALANRGNGSTVTIDSKIFIWTGTYFAEIQSIRTKSAFDWESFSINGKTYLAVANWKNNNNDFNIDSIIYEWTGLFFSEIQKIPTKGAAAWRSFTIKGKVYLAVANWHNKYPNNYSVIYQWNGNSFIITQSIPTSGPRDWESFIIDGQTYLAVANFYNGTTRKIDSEIFRKESPQADAGKEYMAFETVQLDGSDSRDFADGSLVDWQWSLTHSQNPDFNRTASGETAAVDNLSPGFYTVALTVKDNDGFIDMDEAILAAFGIKGDFDRDGDVDGNDLSEFAENFGW